MRPKVTFRRRGRIAAEPHPSKGAWIGEYAKPSDEHLSPELRDIVQIWRCFYDNTKPPEKDLRATLEALASIKDEDAQRAVRAMDGWTEAQLVTAALRAYKRKHPPPAPIPRHTHSDFRLPA